MPPIKNTDKSSPESNGASDPPKQRKRPGRVPVSCAECRRYVLLVRWFGLLHMWLSGVPVPEKG